MTRPSGRPRGGVSTPRLPAFPRLTLATPRLDIRAPVASDAPEVASVFADRQTRRWLPGPGGYAPMDDVAWCAELASQRQATGTGDHYAVLRREDGRLVGCLWAQRTDWLARVTEVCFAVRASARGFGLAAEALDALAVALLMQCGLQRVELRIAPGNTAARRVAEKAGFVYEGLLRNAGHLRGGRIDLQVWSLVAADLR